MSSVRPHRHLRGRFLVLLAVAPLAAGCNLGRAAPLPEGNVEVATVAEAAAAPFTLGPADRVSIQVFGHPELSTPAEGVLLDVGARVDLPLIGPLSLDGLTGDEARAQLTEALGRFVREPLVSVTVLQRGSRRLYLLGEVERPGTYVLDRPLNALEALSLGGGFRPGADRKQIALLRGNRDQLEVYFFDGATPGRDGLVAIYPDDVIFVRLSGAGTFRDQVLPYVQALVPPLTAVASLIVVADSLNN